MSLRAKRSILRRPAVKPAVQSPDLLPVVARLYASRGAGPDEFDYSLGRLAHSERLGGLDQAAALLETQVRQGGRILIVGDFDADGATSTALAVRALRAMGAADVDYLVPNRFEYGYGLTPEIVEVAAERRPDLIVTVDNGISSEQGVETARQRGISVLVTDHHLPGARLPAADAIVNPNLPGDEFPSKHLAGVGVIFYVLSSLRSRLQAGGWFESRGIQCPNLATYLDLVALGTVADVVPLDYNNRILVEQGLRRIRAGACVPGIRALLEVAGRRPERVTAGDLGFAVGPRLNAAGRLEDMSLGIECLLTEDAGEARRLAERLDVLNRERREIEATMQAQALESLEGLMASLDTEHPPAALTLYDSDWHQGVIGILAARIKERVHRPVIAFAEAGPGMLKGSARSIPGLHIRDALDEVAARHPGLIDKFGGHAMAAGLSLPADRLAAFRAAFEETVTGLVDPDDLEGRIESDGELASGDFTLELGEALRASGPWGQGFPEPLFDGEFEIVQRRVVGERHLKLVLRALAGGPTVDAIAFGFHPEDWPEDRATVHVAYRLDVNEYQGVRRLQLIVEHVQ
ncbi:MAG: single-stranded-DNA-specific exonuclease RecJ [Gammaproteobacteria bacterium]|jgi:single-stranded-DNA-specific exonuclease